jgi:hypothetical protein
VRSDPSGGAPLGPVGVFELLPLQPAATISVAIADIARAIRIFGLWDIVTMSLQ